MNALNPLVSLEPRCPHEHSQQDADREDELFELLLHLGIDVEIICIFCMETH